MVTALRPQSFQRLQLNAGIFLTDFDYSSITTAAELGAAIRTKRASGEGILGATRGGGTFSATPTMRQIEADGKRYEFIGSEIIDSWQVQMTGTLLEITGGAFARVLCTGEMTDEGAKHLIRVRTDLKEGDYLEHLVWVGDMSDGGFLLIDLHNALNTAGATMTFTDKGEGTLPFTFVAHQADVEASDYAPVSIFLFDAEKA